MRVILARMAWVNVPPEKRPLVLAALPKDARVATTKMFGGLSTLASARKARATRSDR